MPTVVLILAVPDAVASANPNCTGSDTAASSVADRFRVGRLVIAKASAAAPTLVSNSIVKVVAGIVTATSKSAPAIPTSSVEMASGAVAVRLAARSNVRVVTVPVTAAWTLSKS